MKTPKQNKTLEMKLAQQKAILDNIPDIAWMKTKHPEVSVICFPCLVIPTQ